MQLAASLGGTHFGIYAKLSLHGLITRLISQRIMQVEYNLERRHEEN